MPSAHAKLSPSASERWLSCPASIRMEQKVPQEEESSYASEGTAAHALAEIEARLHFKQFTEEQYHTALAEWSAEWDFPPESLAEMERHARSYVAYVESKMDRHPESVVMFEQRLDTGVPRCWGTSDTVIVSPIHVEIIDFKYGSGVWVAVNGNPQLKLYALGALDTYGDLLGDTEMVYISVYQPRMDNAATEQMTPAELRRWRDEDVIPIAKEALGKNARFGPSETACRWCPASGKCRAQLESIFTTDFDEDPDLLSPEEIADTLGKVPSIRSWLGAFEEAALDTAYSQGTPIPGYKVVMSGGRRSITDTVGAREALLDRGLGLESFERRNMIGIGELEKLLGKDDFEEILSPFVRKSEGRPSLVPESDKRPAASPNSEAQKAFGGPQ